MAGALGACGNLDSSADAGGDGNGEGGCTSQNPGARCVNPVRFDFEPGDVDIVGDLAADGIDFTTPDGIDGFQITTQGVRLAPGDDDEWCEAFEVPPHPDGPDATWCITRFEVAMTRGYHHLFVAHAPPGSVSEGLMEVGERVRCVGGAHVTYGSDLLPIPLPQGTYVDVPYYEGVGLKLHAGQKLSVNYHYLNASDSDTIAVTKLNFHAAGCDDLVEMRQFGFYNNDIAIPPQGEATSIMSKTFSQDVFVYDLFRHTHRLGVATPIKFYKGPRDGEVIFISPDYEQGAGYRFEEPQLLRAGEGFTIECNWVNPTDEWVRFGPTADDEMCMLLGTWWVANPDEEPQVQHRYQWP
jgi:hypothetical protein